MARHPFQRQECCPKIIKKTVVDKYVVIQYMVYISMVVDHRLTDRVRRFLLALDMNTARCWSEIEKSSNPTRILRLVCGWNFSKFFNVGKRASLCQHSLLDGKFDCLAVIPACDIFTARCNARIASAVLCYGNSVCLSVCPSVRWTQAGIVSKRRHVARCSLHCQIAKCV